MHNLFRSVEKLELPCHRIVEEGKLVQLSIGSTVAGPVYGCKIQPSFYLKFLIDAHLVLGVHDVESLVIGFQPGCEFTGVGKTAVSLLAFFGRDHKYSDHGFSSINGCGGSVFQNLEAFYVVGIQSCYAHVFWVLHQRRPKYSGWTHQRNVPPAPCLCRPYHRF